jgi:hypothetical protein
VAFRQVAAPSIRESSAEIHLCGAYFTLRARRAQGVFVVGLFYARRALSQDDDCE